MTKNIRKISQPIQLHPNDILDKSNERVNNINEHKLKKCEKQTKSWEN